MIWYAVTGHTVLRNVDVLVQGNVTASGDIDVHVVFGISGYLDAEETRIAGEALWEAWTARCRIEVAMTEEEDVEPTGWAQEEASACT